LRCHDNPRYIPGNFGGAECKLTEQRRRNRKAGYPAKVNNSGGDVSVQSIGLHSLMALNCRFVGELALHSDEQNPVAHIKLKLQPHRKPLSHASHHRVVNRLTCACSAYSPSVIKFVYAKEEMITRRSCSRERLAPAVHRRVRCGEKDLGSRRWWKMANTFEISIGRPVLGDANS
jgi:hypothetical protein